MKFGIRTNSGRTPRVNRRARGFTLAEVLAALAFMAIVIPVAVQGLRIASLSGALAQRKTLAARVGERVLAETTVTRQSNQSVQRGTAQEGPYQFQWTIRSQPWEKEAVRQVSVDVTFAVQGQDYSVQLSTLMETSTL